MCGVITTYPLLRDRGGSNRTTLYTSVALDGDGVTEEFGFGVEDDVYDGLLVG